MWIYIGLQPTILKLGFKLENKEKTKKDILNLGGSNKK